MLAGERIISYRGSVHPADCKGTPRDIEVLKARILHKPGNNQDEFEFPHFPTCEGCMTTTRSTALDHAACLGHAECVRILIEEAGHDPTYVTLRKTVCSAFGKNSQDCVKILKILMCEEVILDADPDLIKCCIKNSPDSSLLQFLLENGINPNAYTLENYCPIYSAFANEKFDSAVVLLLHGAPFKGQEEFCSFVGSSLPHCLLIILYDNPQHIVKALHIYKMFGGNMWRHCRYSSDESVTLLGALELYSHLKKIIPRVEVLVKNPLSLLALSRLAIKKAIGRDLWKHANDLPLPAELKRYLNFRDLMSTVPVVNTQPSTSSGYN